MVIIHAFIKINGKKRTEFLEYAKEIVKHSQAEEGNIAYQLYEESSEPNSFVMLEKWKNQAAIDYHNGTKHFKSFFVNVEGFFLDKPRVEIYEVRETEK